MNSHSNITKYVRVNATVVSVKYAKTLFVIDYSDVSKFEECGIKPKSKDYEGKITYSVSAKLQPEAVNALYGAVNLGDLVLGATYKVVFKVYKWQYNDETGLSLNAFVKELVSEPVKKTRFDDTLLAILRTD
jgi:predicted HicB family RNase H-like nuclease